MISELYSWSSAFIDCIPRVKSAGVTIPDKGKLSLQFKSKRPEVSLKAMYSKLSKSILHWSFLRGYNIPTLILYIDEANRLDYLLDSGKGARIRNNFLLVENSKEANRFHVIMTSSDSFFLKSISQFVDQGSFVNLLLAIYPKNRPLNFGNTCKVSKRILQSNL